MLTAGHVHRSDSAGRYSDHGGFISITDRDGGSVRFPLGDAHQLRTLIFAALVGPGEPCVGERVERVAA